MNRRRQRARRGKRERKGKEEGRVREEGGGRKEKGDGAKGGEEEKKKKTTIVHRLDINTRAYTRSLAFNHSFSLVPMLNIPCKQKQRHA